MRPYIDEMRKKIADALLIDIDQVNVKATTEEGLGFTGRKEGIASQAICMITSAMDAGGRTFAMDADRAGMTEMAGVRNCSACPGCARI